MSISSKDQGPLGQATTVRFVGVFSRNGAAVQAAWQHDALFRRQLVAVVTDRDCAGEVWARERNIPVQRIEEPDNRRFSDGLAAYMDEVDATHAVLAFTRLLEGDLLERYQDRLINLHPGLLPAFKGLHGFEEAREAGVRFVGSTIHMIDQNMDCGRVVIQTASGFDWQAPETEARQRQYEELCVGLVQVCHWLEQGRISNAGSGTHIQDASFGEGPFSPRLDSASALELWSDFQA
ncbi:MAG: hypothetical protein JKY61_05315 [Planctomycetes bacterium]|nr:hypothetical protein [Planctomycetota bacterium]